MPSFCAQCGTALKPDAKFCEECGAQVRSKVPSGIARPKRTLLFVSLSLAAVLGAGAFLLFVGIPFDLLGKKAQIIGEVFDGFGAPLKDVTVSVEGTTFKATTNAKGNYTVGYVPGKIKVAIEKEGYTSVMLDLDIATESTFPAEQIILYKRPTIGGIWFFGQSDYVSVKSSKVAVTSKEFPSSFDKPLSEETYTASGSFTFIEEGKRLRFLDNDGINQQLCKLTDNGVILFRTRFWTGNNDKAQVLGDESRGVAPDMVVREVSLDKGKYAFVSLKKSSLLSLTPDQPTEPIYLFEVTPTLGMDPHAVDDQGRTALMWAAYGGHINTVKALLDKGADVNAKNKNGGTASMQAAAQGHTATVRVLLDSGASVNAKYESGATALTWAAYGGHTDTVKALLAKGADVNAKDKEDVTALMQAARNGHTATVQALLDSSASVNVKTNSEWTALMLAAYGGHTATVRVLLDNGAEMNTNSKDNWTALMMAAYGGHSDTVKTLLAKGADVNARNKEGKTALSLARERGHTEIIMLLDQAGAKRKATRVQIESFGTALDTFRLDVGRYPTTQEGLEALHVRPSGLERWDGPYLKKEIPRDPWGNPYVYRSLGDGEPYELQSYGADGVAGGNEDGTDIKSWER